MGQCVLEIVRFAVFDMVSPCPPDLSELDQILHAIETLSLRFVVLTSPNRDDLSDGGASHYATIVSRIHDAHPEVKVEVLILTFKVKHRISMLCYPLSQMC